MALSGTIFHREHGGGGAVAAVGEAEFGCSRACNQPHLSAIDGPDKEQKTKGGILLGLPRRFHMFLLSPLPLLVI